jgi:hypothetical protein
MIYHPYDLQKGGVRLEGDLVPPTTTTTTALGGEGGGGGSHHASSGTLLGRL